MDKKIAELLGAAKNSNRIVGTPVHAMSRAYKVSAYHRISSVAVCSDSPRRDTAPAQEINFDQINKFESLGTAPCASVRHQRRSLMIASGTS